MVKVAIIVYSTWGHINKLAEKELAGLKAVPGVEATILQIPETLPEDILNSIHAAPKADYPIVSKNDLTEYDAFLFGLPTRYGSFPSQFKALWDSTGGLWASGALSGKYVGLFVSTGTSGGGQEVTVRNTLSNFVHHGMIYVPLGYSKTFAQLANVEEPHGGSPWGAGTFAGSDGSRQPSELELEIAEIQGKSFGEIVLKGFGGDKMAMNEKEAVAPVSETPAAAPAKETKEMAPASARATQAQTAPAEKSSSKCFGCVVM